MLMLTLKILHREIERRYAPLAERWAALGQCIIREE